MREFQEVLCDVLRFSCFACLSEKKMTIPDAICHEILILLSFWTLIYRLGKAITCLQCKNVSTYQKQATGHMRCGML